MHTSPIPSFKVMSLSWRILWPKNIQWSTASSNVKGYNESKDLSAPALNSLQHCFPQGKLLNVKPSVKTINLARVAFLKQNYCHWPTPLSWNFSSIIYLLYKGHGCHCRSKLVTLTCAKNAYTSPAHNGGRPQSELSCCIYYHTKHSAHRVGLCELNSSLPFWCVSHNCSTPQNPNRLAASDLSKKTQNCKEFPDRLHRRDLMRLSFIFLFRPCCLIRT